MTADPLGSLRGARAALESGATPRDLLQEARARVEADRDRDEPLHAFLSLRPEPAPSGGGSDGEAGDDRPGPGRLAGIPVAVKDNLCTQDLPTTCASRMLEGYRSPYPATCVRRLEGAGARVLGKTNMDEFAMGSSTENSAFGPTRNPWDRERVPGGSSGGSAAAVAAGLVPVALGSSTGGSVRQPAALCGVVGLKPTYGRVSRHGLVAFASSLDQVGVLARSVPDAAEVLEVVAGADPRDATCRDRPVPRAAALEEASLEGAVLGVPAEYLGDGLDAGVRHAVEAALEVARDAGADVREVSLPGGGYTVPCYHVVAPAEASSNLARFDGLRFGRRAGGEGDAAAVRRASREAGLGPEVKRRIMLGTYVLSGGYYEAYYLRALAARAAVAAEFRRVFDAGVDAVFAPTSPTTAFRLGEMTDDPYRMYLNDVFTVSANLAGIPAVSLPVGNAEGLPVGAQLMAPWWEEERMLGLAARLEEALEYRMPGEERR